MFLIGVSENTPVTPQPEKVCSSARRFIPSRRLELHMVDDGWLQTTVVVPFLLNSRRVLSACLELWLSALA